MLQCRLAKVDDIAVLAAIEKLAGFNQWSLQQIQDSLNHHHVYVVMKKDNIAGYAVFQALFDEVELLNIVVAPDYQRLHLATYLLTYTLKHYREIACTRCLLEVGVNNHHAQSLYKKLGFQQIAVRKNYYQQINTTEDAIVMQLMLEEIICKN